MVINGVSIDEQELKKDMEPILFALSEFAKSYGIANAAGIMAHGDNGYMSVEVYEKKDGFYKRYELALFSDGSLQEIKRSWEVSENE